MRPRIQEELTLLRQFYPDVQHAAPAGDDWFFLPQYALPPGWRLGEQEVSASALCFSVSGGYPTALPYAFLLPDGINFGGVVPANTTTSANSPFSGAWLQFSWSPETWFPQSDARKGSNLLVWVRSFQHRLKEGA
ncbi:hypothetical protein [Bradyrhizobium sp. CCBAU 53338]|uniref:hypothetical protein n=1 Tax=Bradyrhizobium sp. CCBAU 53338 TaxID=1325111 RepID=UPI00188ABE24|nr:hypothetical protein [Bradyrhizobium sp. CCBAU 53338]QOZ50513.1 hypothetical protein XH90_03430 [Bradyrhizobium sp. CCBAU 53338]